MNEQEQIMNVIRHLDRMIETNVDLELITYNIVSYLAFKTAQSQSAEDTLNGVRNAATHGIIIAFIGVSP